MDLVGQCMFDPLLPNGQYFVDHPAAPAGILRGGVAEDCQRAAGHTGAHSTTSAHGPCVFVEAASRVHRLPGVAADPRRHRSRGHAPGNRPGTAPPHGSARGVRSSAWTHVILPGPSAQQDAVDVEILFEQHVRRSVPWPRRVCGMHAVLGRNRIRLGAVGSRAPQPVRT
jgi:hypothetical protein